MGKSLPSGPRVCPKVQQLLPERQSSRSSPSPVNESTILNTPSKTTEEA
jgi:hypothetical protein